MLKRDSKLKVFRSIFQNTSKLIWPLKLANVIKFQSKSVHP